MVLRQSSKHPHIYYSIADCYDMKTAKEIWNLKKKD